LRSKTDDSPRRPSCAPPPSCYNVAAMYEDTIAAISTPLGQGGIGLVRLTGPLSGEILEALFLAGGPGATRAAVPRRLRYGHIVDPATGQTVDEVLAAFFPAPHTYTREEMAEINGHGGAVPLQRILGLCLARGARLAEPGEFTARAFLNGRLSLDQAEAVLDVVQARTEAGLQLALRQLDGKLASQVRVARGLTLEVLAYLTAAMDFPEEDIGREETAPRLRQALVQVQGLLAGADQGILYRQGVRAAIVGRPNVGKSSLLNALLRQSRAIVTPFPGTTRDTIEETLNLRGLPLVLVDTAGISDTGDPVERLGVERSHQALAVADLALFVMDGSQPLTAQDREIASTLAGRTVVVVMNKADLPQRTSDPGDLLPGAATVSLSALTGQGLDCLEDTIVRTVLGGQTSLGDAALVTTPRHQDALRRAADHLTAALEGLVSDRFADCVTIDLTAAVNALGEITGESASEDLLHAIFSRFCIGK
jgi:tRNA modification GTPase